MCSGIDQLRMQPLKCPECTLILLSFGTLYNLIFIVLYCVEDISFVKDNLGPNCVYDYCP